MPMTDSIVTLDYQGWRASFNESGWFNATAAAERFGKSPNEWIRLPSTQEYLAALERKYGKIPYLKTKRGKYGGTWLSPKLAVRFAQWLDVDFAVWCDEQIDALIRGTHRFFDWKRQRHLSSASGRMMNEAIQLRRTQDGKAVESHHYSNEVRMINCIVTGHFEGVDRDALALADLDLLAALEMRNALMIGSGEPYPLRKAALSAFAADWRNTRTANNQKVAA